MESCSSLSKSTCSASEPSDAMSPQTKMVPPVISSPTRSPELPRMMMRPPYIMYPAMKLALPPHSNVPSFMT
jgi:hypothetical protein